MHLAKEADLVQVFDDCLPGAVPAAAPAYGLDALLDESLKGQTELYFEGGDHETLVRIPGDVFFRLFGGAQVGHFSERDEDFRRGAQSEDG